MRIVSKVSGKAGSPCGKQPLDRFQPQGTGLLVFLLLIGLGSACAVRDPVPTATRFSELTLSEAIQPTRTPFQPLPNATALLQAAPSVATPPPAPALTIALSSALPEAVPSSLTIPPLFLQVDSAAGADLQIGVGEGNTISRWVYALVTPFPSLVSSVSSEDLRRAWQGNASGPFANAALLTDDKTKTIFSEWWGAPAKGAVEVQPSDQLLDYAWSRRPMLAIVPFEALEPRWKVLEIDGQSPVRNDFVPESYSLLVPISLFGERTLVQAVNGVFGLESPAPLLPPSNRDNRRLTVVVMTGVTALVRATAWTMELRGLTYPARDIGDWLREADIAHISNEVPFASNCPNPDPQQPDLRFCSDPRYIALLEDVGTDIVELTGDHFQDWGTDAMLLTLDLYKERGWPYYGGGLNLEEAQQAVTLEHNGNQLVFIGCNAKGRPFAGATANQPGAAICDFDRMHAEIRRLRTEGYLPIATFQHFEYYTYQALPNQVKDFAGMAEAGAVIVSGSQAHHPQAIAFQNGAFIHYGLGNLFFDQLDVSPQTRLAFIDRHVFYDGRHISTELLPIIFEDYARARPMNAPEREQLLREVFSASGW